MTTATTSKPAATSAPAPSQPARVTFQGNMSLEKIDVREQVRKKFDENAHKELTESVRTKGLINAVTLRPSKKDGRFELVAGERRFRAAKAAGLKEIPVRVLDLDDQAAALYQVEENIHRKDLTPIEEARGFKLLLEAKKFTVEQLAQLIDKSMPYVYRAVHLLELPKKAVDAIEDGTLTPAHGVQLLRVPVTDREVWTKELLEDGYDGRIDTAAELREKVENELGSDLAGAKFAKDKPYAGAIACTACPNNSGNQGVLFDGAEKGTCTLKPCFDKKTEQYWKDVVAKLEATGAQVLMSPHHLYDGHYIAGRTVGKEITRDQIKKGQVIVLSKGSGKIHATIEKKEKSGGAAASSYDWQRDQFIGNAGTEAIWKAEAKESLKIKASRKVYEEVALNLLKRNGGVRFAEALGIETIVVSKLTDDQLAAAMIFYTRNFGWHPKKKQIKAEAEKKARAEYKAKKA